MKHGGNRPGAGRPAGIGGPHGRTRQDSYCRAR